MCLRAYVRACLSVVMTWVLELCSVFEVRIGPVGNPVRLSDYPPVWRSQHGPRQQHNYENACSVVLCASFGQLQPDDSPPFESRRKLRLHSVCVAMRSFVVSVHSTW